jgi:hypothetical protein
MVHLTALEMGDEAGIEFSSVSQWAPYFSRKGAEFAEATNLVRYMSEYTRRAEASLRRVAGGVR